MKRTGQYSPEVRERAVRLAQEHTPEHTSQWAAIRSISLRIGCTAETLRKWARQTERDRGLRPGLTTDEPERLKDLERENRWLKRANEILRKTSAYFAQAALDRRPRSISDGSRGAYLGHDRSRPPGSTPRRPPCDGDVVAHGRPPPRRRPAGVRLRIRRGPRG